MLQNIFIFSTVTCFLHKIETSVYKKLDLIYVQGIIILNFDVSTEIQNHLVPAFCKYERQTIDNLIYI